MDCDWDFQLKNPGLASSELTNGVARTGQRALLYATGMDEEDMKKPFVAVINSFSEMVPGHMHMRELAEQVKYGILEGGGIPRETGTIAICDGLCQGHCGMRYPLPSRDLIADSIEMVVQAHHFDAISRRIPSKRMESTSTGKRQSVRFPCKKRLYCLMSASIP